MIVKIHGIESVYIRSEYIKLDSLLKYLAIVQTGGDAKAMILDGYVSVNGEFCYMRGKKIRSGDIVKISGKIYKIFKMSEHGDHS